MQKSLRLRKKEIYCSFWLQYCYFCFYLLSVVQLEFYLLLGYFLYSLCIFNGCQQSEWPTKEKSRQPLWRAVALRSSGRVEVAADEGALQLDDDEKLFDFGLCSVDKHHPDLLRAAWVPLRKAASVPVWNTPTPAATVAQLEAWTLSTCSWRWTPPASATSESGFKCGHIDFFSA